MGALNLRIITFMNIWHKKVKLNGVRLLLICGLDRKVLEPFCKGFKGLCNYRDKLILSS